MKTVSDVKSLPWGSSVMEIVGIVELIHPPMSGAGWGLQNGVLKDERTGETIEFMLSKHKNWWDKSKVGCPVTIRARKANSMMWKAQKPKANVNNGQPFAKLEIDESVDMQWLPLNDTLFRQPAQELPRQASATLAESKSTGTSAPIDGTGNVRSELQRMLALYALTKHEVSKSPFIKENDSGQMDEITWRLFGAGCQNGLHLKLVVCEVLQDLDPAAAEQLRPNYASLMKKFAGREPLLKLILVGAQIINLGQDLTEMTEDQAAAALAREEVKASCTQAAS